MSDPRSEGPFSAKCPTRLLLDQISGKWAMLILIAVRGGPVRFNELKRRIEGVTQKVLGHTLKGLERNGLVERRVVKVKPITVTYEITEHGRALADLLDELRAWSIRSIGDTLAAQRSFDERAANEKNGAM